MVYSLNGVVYCCLLLFIVGNFWPKSLFVCFRNIYIFVVRLVYYYCYYIPICIVHICFLLILRCLQIVWYNDLVLIITKNSSCCGLQGVQATSEFWAPFFYFFFICADFMFFYCFRCFRKIYILDFMGYIPFGKQNFLVITNIK